MIWYIYFKLSIPCQYKANNPKVDSILELVVNPYISFINKCLSIIQRLHVICDSLKYFITKLVAIDEVSFLVVYIVDNTSILFNRLLYTLV